MDKLFCLRDEIGKIDDEIFRLINQRLQISREIGSFKVQNHIPIRDTEHERAIIDKNRKNAGDLGASISRLLINSSCAVQESVTASELKHVVIFGGHGAMGQWATRYFVSRGHTVSSIEREDSVAKAVKADVIVLATPIASTSKIIEALIQKQVKGLVFDLASLKDPIIPAIKKAKVAGLNITSIHPMFGPDAKSLVDKSILICGEAREVSKLFDDTCVTLIPLPIEEHDQVICYISALTHLVNYLFIGMLEKSKISQQLGSTSFKMQLNVAKRVFDANPNLYFEIFSENLKSEKMLTDLENFFQIYKNINLESYISLAKRGQSYLRPPSIA